MSPDEYVGCAALLRDVKPIMKSDRTRDVAESLAVDLEARAAAKAASAQT
jgi:hypothetical protein